MILLLTYAGVALGFSFFCSLAEAVLLSMTPFYVQSLVREGHRSARLLDSLSTNLDQPLAAILSLNTIAHTVGAVGVGAEAARVFGSAYVGLASAVLTLLILVLSEIIPKTIGATWWRRLAPGIAPSVWILVKLLWPLVVLSEKLTRLISRGRSITRFRREELAAMAEVGAEEGALLPKELRIVKSLVRFRTVRPEDVMTPRTVMFTLDGSCTVSEVMTRHPEISFSRIPLYENDPDKLTSMLLKADLYLASGHDRHDTRISELARPLTTVPTSISLMALFERLLDEGQHIAVLLDEYGGVAGLVTLEDVIETLLGLEIVDELDTTEDLQEHARALWRERASRLGLTLPDGSAGDAPLDVTGHTR
jgi:CBS domain containing-hemolysin-like protein